MSEFNNTVSPLRQPMTDDMTVRKFSANLLHEVKGPLEYLDNDIPG